MMQLLNETVAYYGADIERRGLAGDGTCQYYVPETKCMCALGRIMEKPEEFADIKMGVGTLSENYVLSDILKEGYKDMPARFLAHLQDIHDIEEYWSAGGLTEMGRHRFNETATAIVAGTYV